MNEPIKTYQDYQILIAILKKEHADKISEAKKSLRSLQSKCIHKNTRYEPDASGNNDSYTWCLNCGVEL